MHTRLADIPQLIKEGDYEINMPLQFLQKNILEWKEKDNLQLNPDFQRGHVWSMKQRIAWVEYFLMGGKSGRVIYFNAPWWQGSFDKDRFEYKDFVLVDGLQRLTSLLMFLNNEVTAFGLFLSKGPCFEDSICMSRASYNLRFNINSLRTKKDVLIWYLQMNTGGTPHTKKEIARVQRLLRREEEKECCK